MSELQKNKKINTTNKLVKVALLSAIAFILMFLEMPIPGLFPDFLKIDLSDIPAIMAGLALGPLAGFVVEVVKNVLHAIVSTTTGGIGEVANIIVGSAYVVTASFVWKKSKAKSLIKGFVIGTITMVVVGSLINYFVMLPFYGQFMGLEAIINIGKAINPKVKDLFTFVIWFIAPFNLIKGILISIISIPLYKKLEKAIKK